MSTTLITSSSQGTVALSAEARPGVREPAPEPVTLSDMLQEVLPLVGVVLVAGPPALVLAMPFVLLALAVCGAFVLMVTYVVAGVAIIALGGAIVTLPYSLVRRLAQHRAERAQPAERPVPAPASVPAVA
jgi:hypothetical protein